MQIAKHVFKQLGNNPANIRLDEDVFRLRLRKTSSRRLDQDEYVRLSLTSSEDVFKTSWSRPIYSSWLYVFKTFSRCFEDVLQKGLQNMFKTSSRRFEDVFKTSSRRLEKLLQDIIKTYHQVKLFLLTRL